MSKSVCANCQFFCKHYRDHAGTEYTFEVTNEQRTQALQGDFSWQRPSESIACYKGIWDEGLGFAHGSKEECISKQGRSGKCYFFQFQPGMLLPAAEELQQEQVAKAKELQKYRLSIYALLLTILSLLIALILR